MPAGCAGKLLVVFLHNLPNGHEKSMRAAGVNNTDPGCWQQFVQHCTTIVNMTFDENRWQWHEVNKRAAQEMVATIREIARDTTSKSNPGSI